ncbi:MAG: histidine--tRNA ligase [Gemmatimonadota bacterium]
MEITGLPGFRDFDPGRLALRRHIVETWRCVARRYGFAEYDGPPLEPLELYTRKSGPEIVAQLYGFTDKGGREVALRPEMTPTFARMIAARAAALPKPIRWFSIPQLFRYERPQRGRLREHFQLNMDIVGEVGVGGDAEVIAAAVDCLRALGLEASDIVARVSDRRLMAGVLKSLRVPETVLPEVFGVLDRAERESASSVVDRLAALGLSAHTAERILATVGVDLDGLERQCGADETVGEAVVRLRELFTCLGQLGVGEYVEFDAGLVRGLAYYTGMVFEIWERSGKLRAICGGGRYDSLLASLGGPDLPAAGFGMGDVVLGELLLDRGLVPEPVPAIQDFVVPVSARERALALRLVQMLRSSGRRVAYDFRQRAVGKQFRAADQAGAERVIVLGPEEAARGTVKVRTLATGEEMEVSMEELTGWPTTED